MGARLRELREAMGLSRQAVAEALQVSESRIQHHEGGERVPAARLWQFCNIYGVDVHEVFGGLPSSVGPQAALAEPGVREAGARFETETAATPELCAIMEAAAQLSPFEQRLALAAIRGMGTRKLKRP
ncbi:helix-turn-helix domain-containing protein [Brevundimonas sp. PAMC22021]|uniref:helix-turn-helix domain-containing protein n=1 Tax=Brevundimonas sp. PAMC22021 TaxID=2861285 RepID=UPI001C639EB6|nr:helix-turn-helix domain-containing protein [Brevundimonas sp. PAMC22021]QYF86706.1 helix-turn-helix domain-containing protein [Brevundimonas sp. PAMC22021]